MRIQFIGAAGGTITGSCTLFEHTASNTRFLVDCGLAQGEGQTDAHNKQDFPFDAGSIRFVLLTHAHLDHCGLLPKLYREGFKGEVYCTQATAEIARLSLMDGTKHPNRLFSRAEVEAVKFTPIDDRQSGSKWMPFAQNLTASFQRTAHIVGASSICLKWQANNGQFRHLVMSGDLGNNTKTNLYQTLLAHRKGLFGYPDHVVVESTYGAREREPRFKSFEERIKSWRDLLETEVFTRKATLIIPAFALQRTHEVLLDVAIALKGLAEKLIPVAPCLAINPQDSPSEQGAWLAIVKKELRELRASNQQSCQETVNTKQDDNQGFGMAPNSQYATPDLEDRGNQAPIPYPVDVVLDAGLAREMGVALYQALMQTRPGKPDEYAYRNGQLKNYLGLEHDQDVDALLKQLLNVSKQENVTIPWGPHTIKFIRDFELPTTVERTERGLILITGGGMCDGGPVVSHLKNAINGSGDNLLVQVGYMAPTSQGGQVINAIKAESQGRQFDSFELDGATVEANHVRLRHADMSAYYSGHADRAGLLDFIMEVDGAPNAAHPQTPIQVFINHGSAGSRQALKEALELRAAEQRPGDRQLAGVMLPQADGMWYDLETGERVNDEASMTLKDIVRELLAEQKKTNSLLRTLVQQNEARAVHFSNQRSLAKPTKKPR